MAQKTRSAYQAALPTRINDNSSEDITPQDVREEYTDVTDSAVFLLNEWPYAQKGPAPAQLCATGNVDLTSELENGDTIDGTVINTGERVLLISQTDASENGIYVVPSSGTATRANDFSTTDTIFPGASIYVERGDLNAKTLWTITAPNTTITVDTSNLTFERYAETDTGQRLSATSFTITKKNTIFTGSSDTTVTLPTPSDAITWRRYFFANDGSANAAFSGESFTAYPGSRYIIMHDGTNWIFKG